MGSELTTDNRNPLGSFSPSGFLLAFVEASTGAIEKVAQPLFRGGSHESFVSISCEIVGEAFARSVIPEVHAPGNDGISFYSAAFGRRNSLQEGFFDKLKAAPRRTGGALLLLLSIPVKR